RHHGPHVREAGFAEDLDGAEACRRHQGEDDQRGTKTGAAAADREQHGAEDDHDRSRQDRDRDLLAEDEDRERRRDHRLQIAALGSTRSESNGESTGQTKPTSIPSSAATSVIGNPMTPPSAPPVSAPTGIAPPARKRIVALTRPWRRSGVFACRTLTASM